MTRNKILNLKHGVNPYSCSKTREVCEPVKKQSYLLLLKKILNKMSGFRRKRQQHRIEEDIRRDEKHNTEQEIRDKPRLYFKRPGMSGNQTIGKAIIFQMYLSSKRKFLLNQIYYIWWINSQSKRYIIRYYFGHQKTAV